MKKLLLDFIKPNKWKILLTVLWGFIAFTLGYDGCASCCGPGAEDCIAMCCREFSPYLFPFIESSPLGISITLIWWYFLSCVTFLIVKYIIVKSKKPKK